MRLTAKQRTRFCEEAITDVARSSARGMYMGITVDDKSHCCDAELEFNNFKRHPDEEIIIADIICIHCGCYLGDTTVSETKIRR